MKKNVDNITSYDIVPPPKADAFWYVRVLIGLLRTF